MHKIMVIAKREYRIGIRKWSFWLVTLGLPLLIASIGLFSVTMGLLVGSSIVDRNKPEVSRVLGVLDHAGLMDWASKNEDEPKESKNEELTEILDQVQLPKTFRDKFEEMATKITYSRALSYKVFTDREEGLAEVKSGEIRGLLEIEADFLETYAATLHMKNEEVRMTGTGMITADLREAVLSRKFDPDQINDVLRPLDKLKKNYLQEMPKKEEEAKDGFDFDPAKFALPFIFMFLMMLGILTSVDRLLRGLVEEKSNRVIEVLLSSTTAEQLMAGKVAGLGALGLTQLGIWVVLGLLPAGWLLVFVDIDLIALLVFFLYFVLGYFLLAILVLALGSLGSNLHESNQLSAIVIILSVVPMMTLPVIMQAPDGLLARIFSFFPLTSPIVVMMRYGAGAIPAWELIVCLLILIAALLAAIKICAKIFRVGILMTGKPPNPAALLRALRQS